MKIFVVPQPRNKLLLVRRSSSHHKPKSQDWRRGLSVDPTGPAGKGSTAQVVVGVQSSIVACTLADARHQF